MTIHELRAKRAQVLDQMEALLKGAVDEQGQVRAMTAEEDGRWQALETESKMLGDQLARAESLEAERTRYAQPLKGVERIDAARSESEPKGTKFARAVRALAAAKGIPEIAAKIAAERYGDEAMAKALSASSLGDGGALVPPGYSTEIIELLRPMAVVRASGARILPMPNGTLTLPKITGGSSADYIGENSNIGKTQPTTGQLKLVCRKLSALVPISNDLIRFSSPQADEVVRMDLLAAMAEREDAAFIRDDGTGNAPKGLRHWAPSATNVISANGTVNLANVSNDLGELELALLQANVRMIQPGWLMAPRTMVYLQNLRDGNGNLAFPEVGAGMLRGKPYKVTTQIPVNLGSGTDESELYLGDFADAIVGESGQVIVDVSSEAAYHDGSNVVSAFSLDQTVIRVIAQHDFGMRHDASVAVLTAVKWIP